MNRITQVAQATPEGTETADARQGLLARLRDESGETIVETLVATVIVTLTFVFLTNAIVTAARINDKIRNEDVSVDLSRAATDGSPKTVTVSDGHVSVRTDKVQKYVIREDDGGERYAYYEHIVPEEDEPGEPAEP